MMKILQPKPATKRMTTEKVNRTDRRKLLQVIGISSVAAVAVPSKWSKPVIDAVVLPAHAQTSCTTDTVVGGPLLGSGSATCQAACEAEAAAQGAQLCSVDETLDGTGATQCGCSLDLP